MNRKDSRTHGPRTHGNSRGAHAGASDRPSRADSSASLPAAWKQELAAERAMFRMPHGLTARQALEFYGRGLADPSSMDGLHRLRIDHPETWHLIVWTCTPKAQPFSAGTTVREILTSRRLSQLMPRSAGDFNRLKRYRASAGRIRAHAGSRRVLAHDDALLEADRQVLSKDRAASTVARDLSLLRRAVRLAARRLGVEPAVSPRPQGPSQRTGVRRARDLAAPGQLADLLPTLDAPHRAAVAFAAGAGLSESEILGLRHGELALDRGAVLVRTGRSRGHPDDVLRWEPIAPWAVDLLARSLPAPMSTDPAELLFPGRDDWTRPRSDLNRGLARACKRVFGEGGPAITLGACRRLWQAVLREAKLPRAAVRQSLRLQVRADNEVVPAPWSGEQAELLGGWTSLTQPPVALPAGTRVPTKAPEGVGAFEAEVDRAARPKVAALPASCQRKTGGDARDPGHQGAERARLPPAGSVQNGPGWGARGHGVEDRGPNGRAAIGPQGGSRNWSGPPGGAGGLEARGLGGTPVPCPAAGTGSQAGDVGALVLRELRASLRGIEGRVGNELRDLHRELDEVRGRSADPAAASSRVERSEQTTAADLRRALERELAPLRASMRRLEQGQAATARSAFAGAAVGAVAGEVITHPDEARQLVERVTRSLTGPAEAPLDLAALGLEEEWPLLTEPWTE